MLLLIASVEFSIVGLLIANHAKDDFEQPLAETPQGARMRHTGLALLSVISPTPRADSVEAVGPQVNGMAHKFVAVPTDPGFVDLTRFKTDRGSSGIALQHLKGAVAARV
jgi:hypothetical protein